jgi:tetratricopeptide (TPR) repeat protein
MNRKERRRAESSGASAPNLAKEIQQLLAAAYQHHQAGRLPEAEQLYARILAADPDQGSALHLSGALSYQLGRHEAAVDFLRKAIRVDGSNAECHLNLGLALRALGRLQDAVSAYSEAIRLQPTYFNAHLELGSTLASQGKLDEAAAELRRTLSIRPSSAEAHNNLGSVLQKQGKWDEAIDEYQQALKLNSRNPEALVNLAGLWLAKGQVLDALGITLRALTFDDSERFRALFVQCLKYLSGHPAIGTVGPLVLRALSESWTRPSEIAPACIDVLKFDSVIGPCIARTASAWPGRLSMEQIFAGFSHASFAEDPLARKLLESTQVCNVDFERFLTAIRFNMIKNASAADSVEEPVLGFYCSLARQCFINEYVFACTEAEMAQAETLRDKLIASLQRGQDVPALWVAAVAAYFPLHSLSGTETLLNMRWPDAVNDLLTQQVREPLEERASRASIPALTAIGDGMPAGVKEQYEDSPYPRWVKLAPAGQPFTVQAYLEARFPRSDFANLNKESVDVLIAGSGTGQHPLDVARRYKNVQLLAIDRSLANLAYAQRAEAAIDWPDLRRDRNLRRLASPRRSVCRLAHAAAAAAAGRCHAGRPLQRDGAR